jgi:putative transposase
MVRIWTLSGRMKIPFVCGERQRAVLAYRKGEVDLMLLRGKRYLARNRAHVLVLAEILRI